MQNFFPAMTKIVGTLGSKSRSVDVISGCLKAGMSGMVYFFFFQCLMMFYMPCVFEKFVNCFFRVCALVVSDICDCGCCGGVGSGSV